MENKSSQIKSQNPDISYEEIMTLKEPELSEILKSIKINNIKKSEDLNKCLNNLLNNNNVYNNYLYFIKLQKFFRYDKNSFEKNKVEIIYNKFKDNFNEYKKILKENKQNEKNIGDADKVNVPEIKSNLFGDLKISQIKESLKKFFKSLLYIYDNEEELVEFIFENKEYLDINNQENFVHYFKEVIVKQKFNIINLCEKLLKDIESKKKRFENKEEIQFYEYLIKEYNYRNKNINYIENKFLEVIEIDFDKFEHLDEYLKLFYIQNNKEVVDEMIQFLYHLYNSTGNLKLLLKKLKDVFDYTKNLNIIKLYKYIINEIEKDHVVKTKSHFSLCKKSIIGLKFEDKEKNEKINFYGNTTINEINHYLIKNFESKEEYFDINLKNIKEKQNIIFDEYKTLNDLIKKNYEITIIKKQIKKDKLIEIENEKCKLTKNFQKALKDCFKFFSKGKEIMTRSDLAECHNVLADKKEDKFTKDSIKIIIFLKKYSDNFEYITQDKFIEFYKTICLENNENRMKDVWKNIKNMKLRPDLTKIPQEIKNDLLPRYYLSNEIEDSKDLYLMDIFNKKYKDELEEEYFDFLSTLSTSENIYNNVLNNFNLDENMKFSKKPDEYMNNLYNLFIINSIFEDVEILNKKEKLNISSEEYMPFSSEENNSKKKQFFIDFLNKSYSDLINYASIILGKVNAFENYDEKKHILVIRCCSKSLEIINIIYNSYYNIIYDMGKKNENNKNIEYESLKNIIKDNNLIENIQKNTIYENLINQILITIDKYYNKYDNIKDEFSGKIPNLIKNCYLLLFSLLYTNNDIFLYIKKNKQNKDLLDSIINNILMLEKNEKNIFYIKYLLVNALLQNQVELNSEFVSYLIDLLFQLFDNYIYGKKDKLEGMQTVYLRNILGYSINKEKLYNKIKEKILKFFEYFYNYIDSKNIEGKINEPMLFSIFESIMKNVDKINSLKNELIENKNNNKEITLYDKCLDKFILKEEEKLNQKTEKFKNKEKILKEDKENKFISEEKIKENNADKKPTKNDDNIFKAINSYCNFYLNSKNGNNKEIIIKLISNLKKIKEKEDNEINSFIQKDSTDSSSNKHKFKNLKKKRIKKKSEYIGLRNLGALCYLNSIIQHLFMIPQFRYSILGVDDKKDPKKSDFVEDDNMLHQLQKLFTFLSFTSYGEVIPRDFVLSIKDYDGNPISPNQMQDSNEFYNNFCDKIEESLSNTKYKYLIKNLFIGKICNKNTCNSCNNTSYRFEEFKDITLKVTDLKDIYESLDKYTSDENIDDYNCANCNQKVTLKKSTWLSNLPNILFIHLNRLIMGNDQKQKKINSRFEFPMELNLKKYCIENMTEETDDIYKKKDEYYKYELKGVNIHKGGSEGGHYLNIIKVDKDKWYYFNDSTVNEFDIKNLAEECFGGLKADNKEEKKEAAYLLVYELSKKKPVKISLNEDEIKEIKEKNEQNIIEYDKNDKEKNEKQYDVSKLNDPFEEKDLINKIFHNKDDNSFYKYISYENIQKIIPKEYLLEVLYDNKSYDNLYGNKIINFDNFLIKILLDIIVNDSFNIKDKGFSWKEYSDLIDILIELIISYYSDSNSKINPDKNNIKYIEAIIDKLFLPLYQKGIDSIFNFSDLDCILKKIEEKLFTSQNIRLIFLDPIKELSEKFYKIFLAIIKKNEKENNIKMHDSMNKIINEGENISPYFYKILLELIKVNNKEDELDNVSMESFMPLYYRINKESKENLKEIKEIFIYLINQKHILSIKEDIISEIKLQLNDLFMKSLFDSAFDILNILIKKLQYNDETFSQTFNLNEIQKLYTYCLKSEDKKIKRENQIKLIKLIFGILEINDKFTPNRIQLLLGYPTLVIKKDESKNISLFGVNIMNNDINIEIFKYISYNHIKKGRCVLGLLFPSSHEKNEENYLEEDDRNDLIYELIRRCLGLNETNEGNYFLFKTIYLMQTRSLIYDNLYNEMKAILENANKTNNNKYDLSEIKKEEKECIKLIGYETDAAYYLIKMSVSKNPSAAKEEKDKNSMKTKPELSERFKTSQDLIDEKINKEFTGVICDIIPHEIGKIEIIPVASSKTLSIFRFEYFTTYYTRKELSTLAEEKNEFLYKYIKRQKPSENNNENDKDYLTIDFSVLTGEKTEKDFIKYVDEMLKEKKGIIVENKEVLNEKEIKSTLIRYYVLSKNKKGIIKIEVVKSQMNKDVENNFYLPKQIHDFIEENQVINLINIYRIKNEYNFLKPDSIGINIKTSNSDKYFKEYFE